MGIKRHSNIQTVLFAILFVCIGGSRLSAQAKISFDKTKHNFGAIKEEEGPVETIFVVYNTGDEPLKLLTVKGSCGCIVPVYTREPIAPGEQGFVKVQYNPKGRPGLFNKSVTIETNGKPEVTRLFLSGTVTPRPKGPRELYPFVEGNLLMRTNHLTFGSVYKDEKVSRKTVLYNDGDRPIRLSTDRTNLPPYLSLKLDTLVLLPGKTTQLEITYDASRQGNWGFVFENFFLVTSDSDKPMKRINVSIDIKERFDKSAAALAQAPRLVLDKAELDMGTLREGDIAKDSVRLSNTGKSTLVIRQVESPCGCTRYKLSQPYVEPGQSAWLYVLFNSQGRKGVQRKDMKLICNDPRNPERNVIIKAKVDSPGPQPEGQK